MQPDPRSMSDRQLLDACTLLPWERRLSRFVWSGVGCATWAVTFAATLLLLYLLARRLGATPKTMVVVGAVGLMPSIVLYLKIEDVAGRRRNRYWREIGRRFAGLELREYLQDMESTATAGTMCVVLTGCALPHGGAWLVHAWLDPDGRGRVERRSVRPSHLTEETAEGVELASGVAPLEAGEAEALRVLISEAVADRRRSVDSEVKDGAPAEVAVWAWGRGAVKLGSCNLVGVPADKEHLPVVRLMRRVQELGQRVASDPQAFGSFNCANGEIQLGEA